MEAVEQTSHQVQLLQALPKQPHRLGIRHPIPHLQYQKTHEIEPVAYLVYETVGEVLEVLQNQHLEHQHDIE